MMIPHVVLTQADKVYVNILNNQTVALADGDIVVWNTSTPDGVRTTQAAANTLNLVVGAAAGAIAASGYGLAQAYGYKSAVNVINGVTTIAAGDLLKPVAAKDYLTWDVTGGLTTVPSFAFSAPGVAYVTQTTLSAATTSGVFLRCM